ncbi:hypothetical protein D3C71_1531380 [compost metagenome]
MLGIDFFEHCLMTGQQSLNRLPSDGNDRELPFPLAPFGHEPGMFLKWCVVGRCGGKRPMSERRSEFLRLGEFCIELRDSRFGAVPFVLPFALHPKILTRCGLRRPIDIDAVLLLARSPVLLSKGGSPHCGKQCASQILELLPRLWWRNLLIDKVHCTGHAVGVLTPSFRYRKLGERR